MSAPDSSVAVGGRQSGKLRSDIAWNLTGLAIIGVSGVALNAMIAAFYADAAVLGVFNQVFAAYVLVSQFAAGGVHLSTQRAVARHSDDRQTCVQIIAAALLLTAGMSALFCAAYYFGRGAVSDWLESPAVATGMAWSTPGLFCFALNKTLLGAANGLRRMRLYAIAQSLRGLLMIAAAAAAIAWGLPGAALAVVLSVSEGCVLLLLLAGMAGWLRPPRRAALREWSRAHFTFGVRGAGSGVLLELNTRIDVLLLGWYGSDAVVGIYSFAAMLAQGLAQFPLVIGVNLNPLMARHLAQGARDELARLIRKGRRTTFWFMLAIGAAAVSLYPLGVRLIGDPQYGASWSIFAILMAGVALTAGYMPFSQILLQAGRPGAYTLMTAGLVAANAVGNLLLIPLLGAQGAAIATAFSYVLMIPLLRWTAHRLIDVRL